MSNAHPAPGLLAAFARFLLRRLGWKAITLPELPRQAVIVAYPHTSNWDFLFGMLGKWALGIDARWVGKDSLFRWPVAGLLRAWGGIPVNRRDPAGFVESIAAQFARHPDFLLAIAPEGTRSLTPGWKSGFYRIALAAQVPVILACLDYQHREVGLIGQLIPSGDLGQDLRSITTFYSGRSGLHPALASPICPASSGEISR